MALVQTHRFNWMGYEGTESENLNLALLRPINTGNLRYSDYQQRQHAVEDISTRLKLIKRDLGLLPPEEEEELMKRGNTADVDDDLSPEHDADVVKLFAKYAGRRKQLRSLKDAPDASSAGTVFYHPGEPTDKEQKWALNKFNLAVRSLLCGVGETSVSYLDGNEFTQLPRLKAHNKDYRDKVQSAAKTPLPAENKFDTAPVEAALERSKQVRMKLDAVRAAHDKSYAARCIRKEELNKNGLPLTHVSRADGSEQELVKKLVAARKKVTGTRLALNKQAHTASRKILKEIVNADGAKSGAKAQESLLSDPEKRTLEQPEARAEFAINVG